MGNAVGQESTVSYSNTTEIITNVIVNTMQACGVSYTGSQRIRIIAGGDITIGGTIRQIQTATINVECVASTESTTEQQNQIEAQIKQAVAQAGEGVVSIFANQESTMNTNIHTLIESNITKNFIQNCAASVTQGQDIEISAGGSVKLEKGARLEQVITTEVVMKCVQNSLEGTSLGNFLKAVSDQASTQESKGPLAAFFDMIGGVWVAIAVIVAIVVLVIVAIVIKNLGAIKGVLTGSIFPTRVKKTSQLYEEYEDEI